MMFSSPEDGYLSSHGPDRGQDSREHGKGSGLGGNPEKASQIPP